MMELWWHDEKKYYLGFTRLQLLTWSYFMGCLLTWHSSHFWVCITFSKLCHCDQTRFFFIIECYLFFRNEALPCFNWIRPNSPRWWDQIRRSGHRWNFVGAGSPSIHIQPWKFIQVSKHFAICFLLKTIFRFLIILFWYIIYVVI